MSVSEVILRLCKERGITRKKVEQDLGFGSGYFSNLKKTNGTPNGERLEQLASYFHVPMSVLLEKDEKTKKGLKINVLGRVAAGVPIDAIEEIIGQEEITPEMAEKGTYFGLKIKGDSMTPLIFNGDLVIVRCQPDVEDDEIAVVIVNGNEGCCKKIKHIKDGIMLISLNPAYEPMIFTSSEVNSVPVQIVGKVVELRREF